MQRTRGRGEHPSIGMLALLAGGDLSWVSRRRIQRHLLSCAHCDGQVALIRAGSNELRREAKSETLTSFEAIADWSRLESEMVGNIAVGVSAARCIDHVHKSRRVYGRIAIAAGLMIVFALGWTTHIPSGETSHLVNALRGWAGLRVLSEEGTVLRSTPGGVAVRSEGSMLTILHPRFATVAVSGSSAVGARYVDEDTGQVTITSVYGQ